jgi:hypothetical protein
LNTSPVRNHCVDRCLIRLRRHGLASTRAGKIPYGLIGPPSPNLSPLHAPPWPSTSRAAARPFDPTCATEAGRRCASARPSIADTRPSTIANVSGTRDLKSRLAPGRIL